MFILIFVPIIILCPFPIKFSLEYLNGNLKIYIFKKEISLNKIKNKKKKNYKRKRKGFTKYLTLFNNLNLNTFLKPNLKIEFFLQYGFEEAHNTALFYGVIQSFIPFINKLLLNFFNFKKIKYNIYPCFNEELIHFKIDSIIYVNIVKIIYMAIKLFNKIKSSKY
ncbi:DUF2953 domain-containing protein [Haloimpatiens sp. FM7315]|uniref:DUF2953 domain-containing protein n=1 Tax=Haloimpatiens sp. FM7315 TaxID=3298609 RepID=UPI003977BE3E